MAATGGAPQLGAPTALFRPKIVFGGAPPIGFLAQYDVAPDGRFLINVVSGGEEPRTQLVLGPWVHGAMNANDHSQQARSGERVFGEAAVIDYDALILRFMDRYVRGMANGVEAEAPVRLFVMGENVWRNEAACPTLKTP